MKPVNDTVAGIVTTAGVRMHAKEQKVMHVVELLDRAYAGRRRLLGRVSIDLFESIATDWRTRMQTPANLSVSRCWLTATLVGGSSIGKSFTSGRSAFSAPNTSRASSAVLWLPLGVVPRVNLDTAIRERLAFCAPFHDRDGIPHHVLMQCRLIGRV